MPIKIENLSYIYDIKTTFQKQALFDINLEIRDGDFVGIVGHTGSGKSTLIGHLNALIKIQSGAVFVDGEDLRQKKLNYKKLRGKVGMVFQYPEYQLFDETVFKDVAFGPKNLGFEGEELASRVKTAIETVGLDYNAIKDRSPFELSGGQMRRVALAGVLAMRPEILVLDEPTAGLDPRGKKEIMELVKRVKQSCSAVVMISHNMDEVARYCSRVIVMSGGKIYGDYTPDKLFSDKKLLDSLGIGLPQITDFAEKLKENGYLLNAAVTDEDTLADQIAAEYFKRQGNA